MKTLFYVIILVLAVVVETSCSSRQDVLLQSFDWSVAGDIAPFSFELANTTTKRTHVSVLVVAESRKESRAGTQRRELGREKLNVTLDPKEKKKIVGQVHIVASGDIVLQAFMTLDGAEPVATAQRL